MPSQTIAAPLSKRRGVGGEEKVQFYRKNTMGCSFIMVCRDSVTGILPGTS
jgi:hypothetical protein